MSRSEWKGVSQFSNHTCCKQRQNNETDFITVQTMKYDDDGNTLTTVKPYMAATVLRAKREIKHGEFLRYYYTDRWEHFKQIFVC